MFVREVRLREPERVVEEGVRVELSWLRKQKAEPCSSLVPDLVTTVIGGAAGHALVGVEVVRRDVDGLDRLGGADVADVVRQPDVDATPRRRCGSRCCSAASPLTQVRSERPGVSISAFWNWRRRRAGDEVDQRLVVAELVQREVDDLLRRQLGAEVGLLGLEQRRLADHVHGLGQGADLELQVHADGVAGGDAQARLVQRAEALERGVEVVDAGEQVAERVRLRSRRSRPRP